MVIDEGYMCRKCKKIYHKSKYNLPIYCKRCGEKLVEKRYSYNLVEHYGKVVETQDSNMFGGYDYTKTILTDNVEKIKVRRRYLFLWEFFERIEE